MLHGQERDGTYVQETAPLKSSLLHENKFALEPGHLSPMHLDGSFDDEPNPCGDREEEKVIWIHMPL